MSHQDAMLPPRETGEASAARLSLLLPPATSQSGRAVVEIMDAPDAPSLEPLYALLESFFKPGEVEPLEQMRRELAGNRQPNSTVQFFGLLLRDPEKNHRIASILYGSVQQGILALRFKLTRPEYRASGISQEADRHFFEEATRQADRQGRALWACFGECVEASEAYFNRLLGMRRLYVPGPTPHSFHEMHYELPHLGAWTADGRPKKPLADPVREHLQMAIAPMSRTIPVEVLEGILTTVWRAWYIVPEVTFANPRAWERHRERIMKQTLQDKILKPLGPHRELVLLSREERQQLRKEGVAIRDFDLHARSPGPQ
jgi:hypothetical protein